MKTIFAALFALVFLTIGVVAAVDLRGFTTAFARRSMEQARPMVGTFLRNETADVKERKLARVIIIQRVIGGVFALAGAAMLVAVLTTPIA